jgi:DNA invertase Pin-like site-specific DNA recombinase
VKVGDGWLGKRSLFSLDSYSARLANSTLDDQPGSSIGVCFRRTTSKLVRKIRLYRSNRTIYNRTIQNEPMFIRAYLRASTQQQDATRARADLEAFVQERDMTVASWYIENESGATLKRPELFRLLADSSPGDVLLIEQVDRLSRLNAEDWDQLKTQLQQKQVRVVALDLPTSWQLANGGRDELMQRILTALNGMMLDMLAAIARKDYEDRRRRTHQGIERAKAEGRYRGRPENVERNTSMLAMLKLGASWSEVCNATGASRSTLARIVKNADRTSQTHA